MDLPASFGKYELIERIATGGMAEVFLARSFGVAGFEKRLVIKRIRPEYAMDPRFVSMFIHEAKVSVHLNHPNIVQVYDLGKVGTSHYIAMEHLHGKDLNRIVKVLRASDKRIPLPEAVAIIAEVCRGLSYAHGSIENETAIGVVHRDVSPHNLIVTFAGEVKLVDFGIARLINSAEGHGEQIPERPGGGKYAYMSPEQARGQEVDHRTDVFSAGIVLWELIVGQRLYQDPDPEEKLRKVRAAHIPHPREFGVDIDDELWRILQQALAMERYLRYSSAAEFEEDLRAWLFRNDLRVGRTEIAAMIRSAFPSEADPFPVTDLRRIVADLEQLDGPTDLTPCESDPFFSSRESEPERKPIVALMIDVDGLTELSSTIEPDGLFRIHFTLLRWLRRIVDRFGGVLQRSVDDQILVFFGIPRTGSDDVIQALDCAMELQHRVKELESKGLKVNFAIGVHSGEVTLTPDRRPRRYESRGNTTRLTRRLSALSDHAQILVSERLFRAASAAFRFRRGPDLSTRGLSAPEPSYILEGRRHGLRISGKGSWMRRGDEIDLIREALVQLGSGIGQALAFFGNEGTGKSRLIREIRDRTHRRGLPMYLGRCQPGHEEGPDPFADLVVDILGVRERSELTRAVPRLGELGLQRRDIDAILALLGLSSAPTDPEALWQALNRILVGLSRNGPVIIALEELHHLPLQQHAPFKHLIQSATTHPILLLLTHRGSWPESLRGIATEFLLGPFPAISQRRLLHALLDADEADPEIEALVERSCEGNPLYIEEMSKFLLTEGYVSIRDRRAVLERSIQEEAIPANLAGLISARIDKLDTASKGILRLAAVFGSSFSGFLLAEAAGLEDPIPVLSELVAHGLVHRVAGVEDRWAFTSELIRQMALRGILGVQRRDYHRLVAAAIERQYADHLEDWIESLAIHCAFGGRPIDAARYAYRAGKTLRQNFSWMRAKQWFERGLAWIREIPDSPDTWDAKVQGEASLALEAGIVSQGLGDLRRGDGYLQLALDIASDAGLRWIEVRAHVELGRAYWPRGRTALAGAHLTQARALLQPSDEAELWINTLEAQAALAFDEGRVVDAEALWQDALLRSAEQPELAARCLIGLATRHVVAGEQGAAFPLLRRALAATQQAGNRVLEGRVLNNIGLLHAGAEQYDDALSYFRRALELREGLGYTRGVIYNLHNIGNVHFSRQDWARAHVAFQRSSDLATEIGWERGLVFNEGYLGYLDAKHGEPDLGVQRLETAILRARQAGDFDTTLTATWLLWRWFAEQGEPHRYEAQIHSALLEAQKHNLQPITRYLTEAVASLSKSST